MTGEELRKLTLDCGATKAAIIQKNQIVLSEDFRKICEGNQCGKYGRCWACPPDAGNIHALMDKVREYDAGVLYQTISAIEDSFDIEGMGEAGVRHAQLSQKIQAGIPQEDRARQLHLSCGGCRLCPTCTKPEGKPCRFPEKVLLSLEGCGIDVYNTTRSTDLKYINGANTVTFFGLILYKEGASCQS